MDKFEKYRLHIPKTIPDKMLALTASGQGFENLAVKELPVPQIGPNQLLARVDAAGVCTSILKLIDQGPNHTFLNGWDMKKWPIILGDEGSVTIVKVGGNLESRYKAGERYAVQPAVDIMPILHRERYRNNANKMRKCAVGYTLGGLLAQYIVIQEEVLKAGCLLKLPDNDMPYFAVSMAEPISCVYSAQQRNYHIIKNGPHAHRQIQMGLLPNGKTLIIGAGPMGRIHAEFALRFNPSVLIVCDLQQQRLDKTVAAIGKKAHQKATKLVTVLAENLEKTVEDVCRGAGADDIILCVGNNTAQQNALNLLADGGVANLFGGLPKGKHLLQVDALAVHYREIKLVGSSGGEPSDMAETLNAIAKNDIDAGNYVAAVGSLDSAIDVLKMISRTEIDGKAILYPHIKPISLQPVDYWSKDNEMKFLERCLP